LLGLYAGRHELVGPAGVHHLGEAQVEHVVGRGGGPGAGSAVDDRAVVAVEIIELVHEVVVLDAQDQRALGVPGVKLLRSADVDDARSVVDRVITPRTGRPDEWAASGMLATWAGNSSVCEQARHDDQSGAI